MQCEVEWSVFLTSRAYPEQTSHTRVGTSTEQSTYATEASFGKDLSSGRFPMFQVAVAGERCTCNQPDGLNPATIATDRS